MAVAAAAVAALALLAALFLPGAIRDAAGKLEAAHRGWLWLAVMLFLASALASAGMWHEALSAAGRSGTLTDACARYGVGSLVNSFTPGRLGGLVRIALFSQTLPEDGRAWATGSGLAAIGTARAVALGTALAAAVALGAVPLWIVGVLLAVGGAGVAAALTARRRAGQARLERALAAFRALGRDPRRSTRLLTWALAAAALRVAALAGTATALDVPAPVAVALILLPTLDLAGLVSLTPGNVGIVSGMTAVALAGHGVGLGLGLTVGIAVHAAETTVGVAFGLAGTLALAPLPPTVRRRIALSASAVGAVAVFAAFTLTMLPRLV
jgi:uncharacterized membrane protein YbhN (UPF0104 family)